MRVLLIGAGGREHALAWKITRSPQVSELVCVPGNAGIALDPKVSCVEIASEDVDRLVALATDRRPDLVVVGPEHPLVHGLVDRLHERGLPVFGPCRRAALLEGSKAFAKERMQRYGIPTAAFEVFEHVESALEFVRSHPGPWVVKADGLAAGKGVVLCYTPAEAERAVRMMMIERVFGTAGEKIVVEALLKGEEASCIAITDGSEIRLLASSQDHKRIHEGDRGPNTGGMGAYSPAPVVDGVLEEKLLREVFRPLIRGLASEGIEYRGVIYAGLMIDERDFKVLEFNVRLGDPETQALLPRLLSDLVPVLQAAASGNLAGAALEWDPRPAVCVVLASRGYPGDYEKGKEIRGLDKAAEMEDVVVFHAGTRREGGRFLTSGGRVLGVTALGRDISQAVQRVYDAVAAIDFDGLVFRRDIAQRALGRS